MISSAGSGFSTKENVSLSKRPVSSDLIASPHFSLMWGDNLRTWDNYLGSGRKSDKLMPVSFILSSETFNCLISCAICRYS